MRARSRGRLRVARDVRVARGARVRVARGARVVLEPGVVLGPESRIDALGGEVRLGAGARLGERAIVVAHARVEIGAGAVVGDWAALSDVGPTWEDAEPPCANGRAARAGGGLGPHTSLGPGATSRRARLSRPTPCARRDDARPPIWGACSAAVQRE